MLALILRVMKHTQDTNVISTNRIEQAVWRSCHAPFPSYAIECQRTQQWVLSQDLRRPYEFHT